MLFLGIDPGMHGYISYYDSDIKKVDFINLNQNKRSLIDKLKNLYVSQNIAYIERAVAYKGQGAKSINTYLTNFGKLLGYLEVLGYKYKLISPKEWQSFFNIKSSITIPKNVDKKTKSMLRYKQRKEVKQLSIKKASEIFNMEIKNNNLADSLLILKYCIEKEGKDVITRA